MFMLKLKRYIKKSESKISNEEKALIINNIIKKYEYTNISLCSCLALNEKTYYNNRNLKEKKDKYKPIKDSMFSIREEYECYGAHRMHDEILKRNFIISYPTFFNLYQKLNFSLKPKKKNNNSGYSCEVPAQANLLKYLPEINTSKVLCTDGVEMKAGGRSIHFAFVMNLATRFILCHHYSYSENGQLYRELLNKLSECLPNAKGFILHTDQGSCFTSKAFNEQATNMGLTLSKSAKGTPTDNEILENFHGILKREIYNGKRFHSPEELIKKVNDYVTFYNYKRASYKEKNTPIERLKVNFTELYNSLKLQPENS